MKYLVTLCERDYRGQRMIFSEVKTEDELTTLVGSLTRSYGSVREPEPGFLVFSGSYQAAHGGMESNGATVDYEPVEGGL